MMKVLEKRIFNNGYGCPCCRRDWEETVWIDVESMYNINQLMTVLAEQFYKNAMEDGGLVGVIYENDGEIIYGVTMDISQRTCRVKAVFNNKEYTIKGYEAYTGERSYTPEEIYAEASMCDIPMMYLNKE